MEQSKRRKLRRSTQKRRLTADEGDGNSHYPEVSSTSAKVDQKAESRKKRKGKVSARSSKRVCQEKNYLEVPKENLPGLLEISCDKEKCQANDGTDPGTSTDQAEGVILWDKKTHTETKSGEMETQTSVASGHVLSSTLKVSEAMSPSNTQHAKYVPKFGAKKHRKKEMNQSTEPDEHNSGQLAAVPTGDSHHIVSTLCKVQKDESITNICTLEAEEEKKVSEDEVTTTAEMDPREPLPTGDTCYTSSLPMEQKEKQNTGSTIAEEGDSEDKVNSVNRNIGNQHSGGSSTMSSTILTNNCETEMMALPMKAPRQVNSDVSQEEATCSDDFASQASKPNTVEGKGESLSVKVTKLYPNPNEGGATVEEHEAVTSGKMSFPSVLEVGRDVLLTIIDKIVAQETPAYSSSDPAAVVSADSQGKDGRPGEVRDCCEKNAGGHDDCPETSVSDSQEMTKTLHPTDGEGQSAVEMDTAISNRQEDSSHTSKPSETITAVGSDQEESQGLDNFMDTLSSSQLHQMEQEALTTAEEINAVPVTQQADESATRVVLSLTSDLASLNRSVMSVWREFNTVQKRVGQKKEQARRLAQKKEQATKGSRPPSSLTCTDNMRSQPVKNTHRLPLSSMGGNVRSQITLQNRRPGKIGDGQKGTIGTFDQQKKMDQHRIRPMSLQAMKNKQQGRHLSTSRPTSFTKNQPMLKLPFPGAHSQREKQGVSEQHHPAISSTMHQLVSPTRKHQSGSAPTKGNSSSTATIFTPSKQSRVGSSMKMAEGSHNLMSCPSLNQRIYQQ